MAQWDRSLRCTLFVVIASACYDAAPEAGKPPPSAAGGARARPGLTPSPPDGPRLSNTTSLRPQERVPISDPMQQAGPPAVGFVEDHWLVAWQATDSPFVTAPHLEVATLDLDADRVDSRRGPELAQSWPSLEFDDEGRLGVLYEGSACAHRVYEADLQPSGAEFALPCTDDYRAAAAPIPETDEWMVTYGSKEGDIVVGSYRPSVAEWISGPRALGAGSRPASGRLDVFATHERAFVVWGDAIGSNVRTLEPRDLSSETVPAQAGDTLRLFRSAISDGGYALDRIENRTVVAGVDSSGLWSTEIDPDKYPVREAERIARSVVIDQRPGTASAALLGLIGMCFGVSSSEDPAIAGGADYEGVAFVLLRPDGRATEPPIMLQDHIGGYGGCDVAWSGSEFLVVYWQFEPSSFETDEIYSKIFVQRIATDYRL